eukprot:248453-Hanusia_phi.AAC.1
MVGKPLVLPGPTHRGAAAAPGSHGAAGQCTVVPSVVIRRIMIQSESSGPGIQSRSEFSLPEATPQSNLTVHVSWHHVIVQGLAKSR